MPRFFRISLLIVGILALFPLYTRYKAAAGPIPPGVYLAGLELSHLKDTAAIEEAVSAGFREPIAVYFGETRLALRPEDVGFRLDTEAMLAEAQQYLNGPEFIEIALRKLAGLPQRRRDVPVRYAYEPEKLAAWLWQVGEEMNHPPQQARVLPPQWNWQEDASGPASGDALPIAFVGTAQRDWQWTPGAPGQKLLLDESAPPILEALSSPDQRVAHLRLEESPPPPLEMEALSRALDAYTSDFPGFAAIYVQDLTTGEEAKVDVDVAFSGMSTMKVAIVTEMFRQMEDFADADAGQWMDYALGESSNFAANLLLKRAGGGDTYAGGRRVTEMMRALGFTNSFVQTGYEDGAALAQIPTPANQRTDWNTNPDSHLQSTPADMGRLLAEIYRCQAGEGALIETFGADITPAECQTILFYMSHDEFTELVWGGLPRPAESWIVHKHGFVNEAHSDLALVWGPAGPYVIAVYLWRPGWMDWDTSNSTMKEISRIVWNFFAFKAAAEGIEPPPPLALSPPPNYVPIASYSSRAATSSAQGTHTNGPEN